jgi:hypothetical protein
LPLFFSLHWVFHGDSTVSKSKNRKHQHTSSNKPEQSQKENTNRHVYIEPGTQIDFVDALKNQHQTERNEDKSDQDKQRFWTKVGAGLVAAYTLVTIWQACLTRSAIKSAHEQFILDERPYVWQSSVDPKPYIFGERVIVDTHWVNYGKSPALQFFGKGTVFYGEHALADADKWFDSLGNGKLAIDGGTVTVIPQGVPSDPKKTPAFGTLFSATVPTAEEAAYMFSHDFAIVVVAREQYEDTSGNVYQSDLCFFRFVSGAIGQCEKHNKMR